MSTRKIRTLLWLTCLGLLALAGAAVGLHLAHPPQVAGSDTPITLGDKGSRPDSLSPNTRQIEPDELKRVASRDLRQRLFDLPVVQVKPPPPRPLPAVQLISTILRGEGDASAWVRDGQTTRKVIVGDRLGPDNNSAKVIAIHADRIVLDHESGEAEISRDQGGTSR